MKVLKFGGKSLEFALHNVVEIIENQAHNGKIVVVVSAIGDTTNELENMLSLAANGKPFTEELAAFRQKAYHQNVQLDEIFNQLQKLYEGVCLLGDYSLRIKDRILAFGELIAVAVLTSTLKKRGVAATPVDSRSFFVSDQNFGNALVDQTISFQKTKTYFTSLTPNTVPVVTGFIAQTLHGDTTTLGRNGSNYTAALLANFLQAKELQNYTHVDGLYTANPEWVKSAKKIEALHFNEANELASFGASILHARTISPLIQNNIPLRILNTLNPKNSGTLISGNDTSPGIKSISIQSGSALICFEGKGLLGKVGIDGRVFTTLARAGISIGVISQGSSERGLGFIVNEKDAETAAKVLKIEFEPEISRGDVGSITVRNDLSVISIIGMELSKFSDAYSALTRNGIAPILFNNSVTGKNVSLVVETSFAEKALNVIHGQIFGVSKIVNLAIIGHGQVGGALIEQLLQSAETIEKRKKIKLNIFAVANSKKVLLNENGISKTWQTDIEVTDEVFSLDKIIDFANEHHLGNLIAIDNTASAQFVKHYIKLIERGFDLISSNKIGNTTHYDFYRQLRETLEKNQKRYLYETNVGAGLPLIDTIKLLHLSGENITRIRGVFSGSLSYIFNHFSEGEVSFSSILKDAISAGYTEPDPREDLSGSDVGRKLLVLARELDLENEFEDIAIDNLIVSKKIREAEKSWFLHNIQELDSHFAVLKQKLEKGKVLRYIGELSGDLQRRKGVLEAKLVAVDKDSPLGRLEGSDSLFEIYTESYGKNPLIIQGAGAGAQVTARGVFGDILRLAGS